MNLPYPTIRYYTLDHSTSEQIYEHRASILFMIEALVIIAFLAQRATVERPYVLTIFILAIVLAFCISAYYVYRNMPSPYAYRRR